MKKLLVILFLFLGSGLLLTSFIAYANQTNVTNYYPSPSGAYTKIHLINQSNGPNENSTGSNPCFCAQSSNSFTQNPAGSGKTLTGTCDTGASTSATSVAQGGTPATYTNAGNIFADSTTGYLEICKSDGTVATYPGSCFTRYGNSYTGCPANYTAIQSSINNFGNATSWSCCFSGGGTPTESGCFSIFANSANNSNPYSPAACPANTYDLGCTAVGTSYERTCCYNASSGGSLTTTQSCIVGAFTCLGTGWPANASACSNNTPPTNNNTPYTLVASCTPAAPCQGTCSDGYTLSNGACVLTCIPATCGNSCGGIFPNGCGGTINCNGNCTPPATCGAIQPEQCGCQANCTGKSCGDSDDCYGTCPNQTCGNSSTCEASGSSHICVAQPGGTGGPSGGSPPPPCVPESCQALGYSCGQAYDNCGNWIYCGNCSQGTCVNNQCGNSCQCGGTSPYCNRVCNDGSCPSGGVSQTNMGCGACANNSAGGNAGTYGICNYSGDIDANGTQGPPNYSPGGSYQGSSACSCSSGCPEDADYNGSTFNCNSGYDCPDGGGDSCNGGNDTSDDTSN